MTARNENAESRPARFTGSQIESKAFEAALGPLLQQALKIRFLPQPARSPQPEALAARG